MSEGLNISERVLWKSARKLRNYGKTLKMGIEVTYLYISGKVTIPKQSEFNVNSYNKDTVNFVNANVLI